MLNRIKIAAVQMEPKLMKVNGNLESMVSAAVNAADNQADLIVFPECSLTGYVFSSRREALSFAQTIPGPSTERFASLCRDPAPVLKDSLPSAGSSKSMLSSVFWKRRATDYLMRRHWSDLRGLSPAIGRIIFPFWELTASWTLAIGLFRYTRPR